MAGQYYYYEGLKLLFQNSLTSSSGVVFTAEFNNNSNVLSAVSSYTGLFVGQSIYSQATPAGAYIVSLDNESGTIVMSAPAYFAGASANQAAIFFGGASVTSDAPLTVHLLQGSIPQGSDVTFAQFTEANYDGYVPQECALPLVINTPPPRQYGVAQFARQVYQPTDYTVQNMIVGHVITYTPSGSTTPIPVCSETYATAVPLQQDGDILTISPAMSMGFDQTAGVASPGIP